MQVVAPKNVGRSQNVGWIREFCGRRHEELTEGPHRHGDQADAFDEVPVPQKKNIR